MPWHGELRAKRTRTSAAALTRGKGSAAAKVGLLAVFVIKGERPLNLRVAEILKKDEEFAKVWYYADRTVKNYDNAEVTPGLRRLVPEWYDKGTGQVNLRPTSRDLGRGNLEKRTDSFARGDTGIVLASFAMHSDGKTPDVQVEKIENGYATGRSLTNVRCVRCRARQFGAA